MDDPKCPVCLAERGSCFRQTNYPDNYCREHHLARERARKEKRHRSTVEKKYGLPVGGYDAIKEFQDGKCYICRRATGAKKNLATDHAHSCCDRQGSCGKCVRSLLCSPCNRGVLGHLRDDADSLRRAIDVIENWPAQKILDELRNQQ
ncbi:endonuclease domain-containing protein [Nocardia jiangxiensis]|uniref:endonuclease domain-containing protein n=1 Tax=Nocardia jiangxiensis TaxID=282685 RepID=UPI000592ADD6|nr:endonuclease domain-containing protein [Nocardia jiangxiensis]